MLHFLQTNWEDKIMKCTMLKKLLIAVTALSVIMGGATVYTTDSTNVVYAATQSKDSDHVKAGNEFYKAAKYNEAIASADKALALNSANADAYYLKGLSYAKLKKNFEAKSNYEKAAFANPQKYYKSIMGMKLNDNTGELSNAIFGLKVTPTEDWFYYDEAGLEEVSEVSTALNANKKMSQAQVESTIAGGYTIFSVYKNNPDLDDASSSNMMIMIEPLYMDSAVKTVDDYIKVLVNLLKDSENFKSVTSVGTTKLNGVDFKSFSVTYNFDGTEISQYYYVSSKDKYAKIIVLTPTNDKELKELKVMLNTIK